MPATNAAHSKLHDLLLVTAVGLLGCGLVATGTGMTEAFQAAIAAPDTGAPRMMDAPKPTVPARPLVKCDCASPEPAAQGDGALAPARSGSAKLDADHPAVPRERTQGEGAAARDWMRAGRLTGLRAWFQSATLASRIRRGGALAAEAGLAAAGEH
jgi:hypothetical protein